MPSTQPLGSFNNLLQATSLALSLVSCGKSPYASADRDGQVLPDGFVLRQYDLPPLADASAPLSIDHDRDGFFSKFDCNDNDSTVHPLRPGQNIIRANTTLCRGEYPGSSIVINGNQLTVEGNDSSVGPIDIQNHSNLIFRGLRVLEGRISVQGSHDVTFQNMQVRGVDVDNSQHMVLRDVHAIVVGSNLVYNFTNSVNNDVIGGSIASGEGSDLLGARIVLHNTHNTKFEGCLFGINTFIRLENNSVGDLISGCTFVNTSQPDRNANISIVDGSNHDTVFNNTFRGDPTVTERQRVGIFVAGNQIQILRNTVDGLGFGIVIADGNQIVIEDHNTVLHQAIVGVQIGFGPFEEVRFPSGVIVRQNAITGNSIGLHCRVPNTYITGNNLTRNGSNNYQCEPLYCLGNTE